MQPLSYLWKKSILASQIFPQSLLPNSCQGTLTYFPYLLRKHDLKKEYFTWKYVKSSGPGGQNVNKTSTKVELRFKPREADWIPETIRDKLMTLVSNRLNKYQELVITSDTYKSQLKNIEHAMNRVNDLIQQASYVPPETTIEQRQKVKRLIQIQNEKRLIAKKRNGETKRERKRIDMD